MSQFVPATAASVRASLLGPALAPTPLPHPRFLDQLKARILSGKLPQTIELVQLHISLQYNKDLDTWTVSSSEEGLRIYRKNQALDKNKNVSEALEPHDVVCLPGFEPFIYSPNDRHITQELSPFTPVEFEAAIQDTLHYKCPRPWVSQGRRVASIQATAQGDIEITSTPYGPHILIFHQDGTYNLLPGGQRVHSAILKSSDTVQIGDDIPFRPKWKNIKPSPLRDKDQTAFFDIYRRIEEYLSLRNVEKFLETLNELRDYFQTRGGIETSFNHFLNLLNDLQSACPDFILLGGAMTYLQMNGIYPQEQEGIENFTDSLTKPRPQDQSPKDPELYKEGGTGRLFLEGELIIKKPQQREDAIYLLNELRLGGRFVSPISKKPLIRHVGMTPREDNNIEQSLFLGMEYLPSGDFRVWIEEAYRRKEITSTEPPLTWGNVVEKMIEISEALLPVHQAGIIHRDVTPGNLMAVDTKTSMAIDASLSVFLEEWPHLPEKMKQMGTPTYMAPESFSQNGFLDQSSDVFSLGVIFLRMIYTIPSFYSDEGKDLTTQVILQLIKDFKNKDYPADAQGNVPPTVLCDFVSTMLQDSPHLRPQNAQEVLSGLRKLSSAVITAHPPIKTPSFHTKRPSPQPPASPLPMTIPQTAPSIFPTDPY